MTKIHTKLLVFFGVLLCSLCLIFGIAACSNGEHVHTFSSEWKSNATIHWHAATCIHAGERSGQGEHNFNDQGKCTVCGYQSTEEHEHTFGGFWLFDGAEGHYQLATCHPEVKSELEPHVDENEDDICDVCDYDMSNDVGNTEHAHTFAEEWTFNEVKHWHNADCEHFTEREDYADHVFIQGVCPCGVKESEVKVYALYQNSPEYNLYFTQWLAWLKAEGITVEYTESGDGIYHYENGTSEVRFLGERTVKVKAQADGEPLADVWFMVTLYTDNAYYQSNGTIALGIAKTDENGIAEIAFSPVGGYSSSTVEYRIRIALADDIAVELGIDAKDAKPLPNRYEMSGANFEYVEYEVNENSNAEDIAATVNFKFSKGWNAYDTIELPYKRYYQDQINGENIKEQGTTYEFTTSGDNLFDYFIFEPAKYSFTSGETVADFAKIEENAKIAASGIYKITFIVEGNANVTLYYWNENGVNMGAYHATKPDGTPSDDYITSISGGTAGDGKYTGGNFVEVVVEPENGLRQYQFGIISDATVKVTFTVERTGDIQQFDYELTVGNNTNGGQNFNLRGNGNITSFSLVDVPEGLYAITVSATGTKQAGVLSAYVDIKAQSCLYEAGQYKGVINIPADAEVLYILNESAALNSSISLVKYEIPKLSADKLVYLPATSTKTDEEFEITFDSTVKSGSYLAEIMVFGSKVNGKNYDVIFAVGDKEYVIKTTAWANAAVTYSSFISLSQGDTVKIKSSSIVYSSLIVGVKLTSYPTVLQDNETNVDMTSKDSRDTIKYFLFTALKTGTYKITLKLLNADEITNFRDLYYLQVENALTEDIIVDRGENSKITGIPSVQATGTFELKEGESILLKFNKLSAVAILNIDFVIEFVEG